MKVTPEEVRYALEKAYGRTVMPKVIFVYDQNCAPKNYLGTEVKPVTKNLQTSDLRLEDGTPVTVMENVEISGYVITPKMSPSAKIEYATYLTGVNEKPHEYILIAEGVCETIANALNEFHSEEVEKVMNTYRQTSKQSLWSKFKNWFKNLFGKKQELEGP